MRRSLFSIIVGIFVLASLAQPVRALEFANFPTDDVAFTATVCVVLPNAIALQTRAGATFVPLDAATWQAGGSKVDAARLRRGQTVTVRLRAGRAVVAGAPARQLILQMPQGVVAVPLAALPASALQTEVCALMPDGEVLMVPLSAALQLRGGVGARIISTAPRAFGLPPSRVRGVVLGTVGDRALLQLYSGGRVTLREVAADQSLEARGVSGMAAIFTPRQGGLDVEMGDLPASTDSIAQARFPAEVEAVEDGGVFLRTSAGSMLVSAESSRFESAGSVVAGTSLRAGQAVTVVLDVEREKLTALVGATAVLATSVGPVAVPADALPPAFGDPQVLLTRADGSTTPLAMSAVEAFLACEPRVAAATAVPPESLQSVAPGAVMAGYRPKGSAVFRMSPAVHTVSTLPGPHASTAVQVCLPNGELVTRPLRDAVKLARVRDALIVANPTFPLDASATLQAPGGATVRMPLALALDLHRARGVRILETVVLPREVAALPCRVQMDNGMAGDLTFAEALRLHTAGRATLAECPDLGASGEQRVRVTLDRGKTRYMPLQTACAMQSADILASVAGSCLAAVDSPNRMAFRPGKVKARYRLNAEGRALLLGEAGGRLVLHLADRDRLRLAVASRGETADSIPPPSSIVLVRSEGNRWQLSLVGGPDDALAGEASSLNGEASSSGAPQKTTDPSAAKRPPAVPPARHNDTVQASVRSAPPVAVAPPRRRQVMTVQRSAPRLAPQPARQAVRPPQSAEAAPPPLPRSLEPNPYLTKRYGPAPVETATPQTSAAPTGPADNWFEPPR